MPLPPSSTRARTRARRGSGCAPVAVLLVVAAVVGAVALANRGSDPASSPARTVDVSGLDDPLVPTANGVPIEADGLRPGSILIDVRTGEPVGGEEGAVRLEVPPGLDYREARDGEALGDWHGGQVMDLLGSEPAQVLVPPS